MKHIKLFEQFINELKTKHYEFSIRESFTYADAIDNTGEDHNQEVKGIKNALKSLKAKSVGDINLLVDTTEDDGGFLYDEIKKMKPINIDSLIYDKAYSGKINGKNVVVFDSAGDLFAYVKESLDFTLADIDADDEEISHDFAALKKYNKYVGARKASDLYLAGGTQDENENDFYHLFTKGSSETLELMMYPAMGGAVVQMGSFQGEPAFQIWDGMDLFIFVGPKSKNKIK